MIRVDEDQKPRDILNKQLFSLLTRSADLALEYEGVDPAFIEVSLSFVPEQEIRELNARYRDRDEATDVLSFPMYAGIEDIEAALEGHKDRRAPQAVMLGDIVICLEVAARQADEIGQSLEKELVYLFGHSMFHLLGHDHENEEDRRRMRAAEEDVLMGMEWGE